MTERATFDRRLLRCSPESGNTSAFEASRCRNCPGAGNFSSSPSGGWPAFPITAKITFNGKTRVMSGAVSSGDCNSCHTLEGASGAPGRVALP